MKISKQFFLKAFILCSPLPLFGCHNFWNEEEEFYEFARDKGYFISETYGNPSKEPEYPLRFECNIWVAYTKDDSLHQLEKGTALSIAMKQKDKIVEEHGANPEESN